VASASAALGSIARSDGYLRQAVWAIAGVIALAAAAVHTGKAADDRSAFIRWYPQVGEFWRGVNIYETRYFPNPPILPIALTPFTSLPPVAGALSWFAFKVVLTAVAVVLCLRMIRPIDRPPPSWFLAGVLTFCLRPFLSDLHHGNNNLVILFLIVAALEAWRRGYDVMAGLVLALAISFKVTPALFVLYFAWRRSWRTVGASALGVGIFLLIVPSIFIGPQFNGECLGTWWHHIMSPFLVQGASSPQEINQSMVGVLTRLLTDTETGTGRYDVKLDLNLVAWSPRVVRLLIKGISVGFVVLLAWLCRTKVTRRDDPRLLGEFALVVMTMLFLSERSWKHHFVTLLLPYVYLMWQFMDVPMRLRSRLAITAALWGSVLFMATTSTELGGLFGRSQGHKLAQGYGMFLWAGMILFVATAWRVAVERNRSVPASPYETKPQSWSVPAPHFSEGWRTANPPA
jgi:alpha-1,2-mannosyltransferase